MGRVDEYVKVEAVHTFSSDMANSISDILGSVKIGVRLDGFRYLLRSAFVLSTYISMVS